MNWGKKASGTRYSRVRAVYEPGPDHALIPHNGCLGEQALFPREAITLCEAQGIMSWGGSPVDPVGYHTTPRNSLQQSAIDSSLKAEEIVQHNIS